MSVICPECGNQLPDDAEFCYKCGATLEKAVHYGNNGIAYCSYCPKCGAGVRPGDLFCAGCGTQVANQQQQPIMMNHKTLSPKELLAIALAVCGGIFNVFGLGQLILKRWSKAFVYISLTLFTFYLAPSFNSTSNTELLLMMVRLMIFFFQLMDVFRAIYIVEEQE